MIKIGSSCPARRCCVSRISRPKEPRRRRPLPPGGRATQDRGDVRTGRGEKTRMAAGAEAGTDPDGSPELAELAGGFIHEIKNHLSTLGLNLQLLAEDFQDPQSQRERRALERVQRLQSECNRLVEISNDFLRFARIRELELKPASLRVVVEEM